MNHITRPAAMRTVTEQIAWLTQQISHMDRSLARALLEGRISPEHADDKMACARATMKTLVDLRGIVRGEGVTP